MVRRNFLAVVVAVVMLLAAAEAAASSTEPFASGGFQGVLAGGANQNIAFSAHQTANGRVVGHITETIVVQGEQVARLQGRVVCLAIAGNTAAIGFVVLESTGFLTGSFPVGSIHSLVVRDSDAGDTFGFIATECTTALIAGAPVFPIEHGNITVRA
jgi:hypothetical protein